MDEDDNDDEDEDMDEVSKSGRGAPDLLVRPIGEVDETPEGTRGVWDKGGLGC